MFDNTPSKLESAHVQRDTTNGWYEQVNISGSDLVIYHDENGLLTADKVSVWAAKYSASFSSSIVAFNGNRAIKRDDPNFVGINVGGNDVVTFLDNFFFPFLPATIAINSGTSYYETGSSQNITITATVTANDEVTFGTGSINRDGVIVTNPSVPPLSFAYTDNGVMVNHSYVGYSPTNNDGSPTVISSATKTVDFIYPFFYGLSTNPSLSGTTLYNALTKLIVPQQNVVENMTGANSYMYFCYPSEYPGLSHVLDSNLFQVLSSFNQSTVSVTSTGLSTNYTHNYTVYVWKTISDYVGNYTFQF